MNYANTYIIYILYAICLHYQLLQLCDGSNLLLLLLVMYNVLDLDFKQAKENRSLLRGGATLRRRNR